MSIVILGKSKCAICGEILGETSWGKEAFGKIFEKGMLTRA